ncbi:hypothetical protein [Corynebacterium lubricantis]|uniref:hypothetical protein n=1 Tax=Corynebacterium lubricantis TaxID=541095 RepID=UPI000361DBA1|nr:hypothetical protein [Corynebacterium lubricantis]
MARNTTKLTFDNDRTDQVVVDAIGSDPSTIEHNAGPIGRALIGAVDKAVHIQGSTIKSYVHRLRRNNPDATPAEIQKIMDRHFLTVVSGTGAGVGATAAVPGVGFFLGTAAVAGESAVFLDFGAVYTVASAYLRGVDISDPERRRTLVLITLLGSKGSAIVDTLMGDIAIGAPTAKTLSRFSGPKLADVNNKLLSMAVKRATKKFTTAWIAKILPLGIGAIAGTVVNRRLAKSVISNVSTNLGATPQRFLVELPQTPTSTEDDAAIAELEALLTETPSDSSNTDKNGRIQRAWNKLVGRSDK